MGLFVLVLNVCGFTGRVVVECYGVLGAYVLYVLFCLFDFILCFSCDCFVCCDLRGLLCVSVLLVLCVILVGLCYQVVYTV